MSQEIIDEMKNAAKAAREAMGQEDTSASESGKENEVQEIDSPEEQQPQQEQLQSEEVQEEAGQQENSEGQDDAEEGVEGSADEGEDDSQPGTTVYQQLNHIRTQKREADNNFKQLLEAIGADSLENAAATIKKLKESAPVGQEFEDFAKEHGIQDPKTVKGLYDLFSAQTKRELKDAIKPLEDMVGTMKQETERQHQENAWTETVSHMRGEWEKDALPVITETWKPDAQKTQQALTLMEQLAHSELYHDKELEYILYKERPQFEAIFGAPKKKTMFPARGPAQSAQKRPTTGTGGIVRPDGSHEGIMRAKAAMQAIKNSSEFSEGDRMN